MFDAWNIDPHQAWTNANDKLTVKDYIFFQNIMRTEKYSNINCTEWWVPAKRCRISIVRYMICYYNRGSGSQTRGAASEIRWDPPNSPLNRPRCTCNNWPHLCSPCMRWGPIIIRIFYFLNTIDQYDYYTSPYWCMGIDMGWVGNLSQNWE